ncbi:Activator of stress genes [Exophiala dermatitidis]
MGDHEMITPQSPGRQAAENSGKLESAAAFAANSVQKNDSNAPDSRPESPSAETPPSDSGTKPLPPMQKRRRVTRACDECRRKKIKCDGKQPCTHCTVYSYECTYDQPSNRRRNPAPQYIEALEQRLQKAEAILRSVLPGLDLDSPKFDAQSIEQLIETSKGAGNGGGPRPTDTLARPEDDAQLQSMVDRTGALDLDDHGNWDFHGHSSGYVFMRKFRPQFGDQFLYEYRHGGKNRTISQLLESPKSVQSSPVETNLAAGVDLPPKEVAIELCRNTLDDCCALMRPIHRPTFFRRLHSVYDTDPEQYNNGHVQFLPLLYVVMAVGCLFSKTENENTMLDVKGYKEAMEQGYQYFNTAKQMVDITDCRDLVTIQTIVFMIMFLQSTAKLPVCYAYIGIALRACCRLGLHRNLPNRFSPVESEERKRIFWLVRKMDSYVGAVLGLPQMLSDDDIDQELPTEVDDQYITEEGIRPMPAGTFPLLKATNAHTRLTNILRKVVRYIYPIKNADGSQTDPRYSISHRRIRELERDLQNWMDQLPVELRPSENAGRELARVQQLLRMSYAHVQMMIYRPFIHYVSQACQSKSIDKRSFACAAACISVARNIVHITSEMKRRGLLVGSYWFAMYTTYFAILSLVFFVIENPDSPTGKDILKDAVEGRDTLAGLAKRSLAADRCTVSLNGLFDVLPEKLKERRNSLNSNSSTASRKRPPPGSEPGPLQARQTVPNITTPVNTRESSITPSRARTLPSDFLAKLAKRNSMPDPRALSNLSEAASSGQTPQMMGYPSPAVASPMSGIFDFQTPQLGNAQIPDLKNVMFPSDNPFAYPNQPISTLESADGSYSFPDHSSMTPGDNAMYSTPPTSTAQVAMGPGPQPAAHLGFDFGFQQQQQQHQQQPTPSASGGDIMAHDFMGASGHFNVPLTDIIMQNAIGGSNLHLGGMGDFSTPAMDIPDLAAGSQHHDEYWNDMDKGMRHANGMATPGIHGSLEGFLDSDGWAQWGGEQHYGDQAQ